MSDNKRSQAITKGTQRSPNRAMLRAVGFGDKDFDKPIVGVANGFSTITPCNMGLNELATAAENALRASQVQCHKSSVLSLYLMVFLWEQRA